jgi:hypothetical protein
MQYNTSNVNTLGFSLPTWLNLNVANLQPTERKIAKSYSTTFLPTALAVFVILLSETVRKVALKHELC